MKNIKSIATGLCMGIAVIGFATVPAHAVLIDNSNTTVDTATNLEWLDLTETTNFSYNAISARILNPGDTLFGYRYATTTDVGTFFTNAGLTNIVGNNLLADFAAAQALVALLGSTGTQNTGTINEFPFSKGLADFVIGEALFADPATQASISQVAFGPRFSTGFADASGSGRALNAPDPTIGSFLIRDANTASIPEPGTLALFGLGFLGIGIARRRKWIA